MDKTPQFPGALIRSQTWKVSRSADYAEEDSVSTINLFERLDSPANDVTSKRKFSKQEEVDGYNVTNEDVACQAQRGVTIADYHIEKDHKPLTTEMNPYLAEFQ